MAERRQRDTGSRTTAARGTAHAPSSFTLHVEANGTNIPVAVTRKRVRNLNLRVHADGTVTMSIPVCTNAGTAQEFLDRKAAWIAERVRRRAAAPVPRDAEDRTTIPLWGALVPTIDVLRRADIRFETAARPATFGAPATDGVDALADLSPEEFDALVDALYRTELAHALPEVATQLEATMGVRASRWSLRRMKTRWGSCTPKSRAIRINTNLAAYPPACLALVVAHELVHLMEPSHNARFHMLLDTYCPGNRTASALLKRGAREVAQSESA